MTPKVREPSYEREAECQAFEAVKLTKPDELSLIENESLLEDIQR